MSKRSFHRKNDSLPGTCQPADSLLVRLRQFVGESPAFVEVTRILPTIARAHGNVLINGETGTGKEVYARAVHYFGERAEKR